MKTEELQAQGLTDEQIKFVMSENGKDIEREKGRANAYRSQLDTANETLKSFEGVDVAALTKERDEWKSKFENAKNEFEQKQRAAEFDKALEASTKDIKFTSNAAKRAFVQEFRETNPELKDGAFPTLEGFLGKYKETDAAAFVDEKQERLEAGKARFTAPIEGKAPSGRGGDVLRQAFGLPPEKTR